MYVTMVNLANCLSGHTRQNICNCFLPATCSNPLYVLEINDSIATVKESPKLEFDATNVCCSGFLITRTNTTTCLENGEWELETTLENCEG